MNEFIEEHLEEIECRCRALRQLMPNAADKPPSQMERLFVRGDCPAELFRLYALDGSSTEVYIKQVMDISTCGIKALSLTVSTVGAPEPAKGE